ncbi:hypothetical protein PtB15_7B661 [Puccinia triticina]|nr:hypothetical protein PtB15_7B661 [Puccinia triticina]
MLSFSSILTRRTAPTIQKPSFRNGLARHNSSKSTSTKKPTYQPSPSPPPLPPKEQKEFISLINQSNSSPPDQPTNQTHPDLRNLGPEEFQGDVNPRTGEVNGPKRDPLKWPNEWGYGGYRFLMSVPLRRVGKYPTTVRTATNDQKRISETIFASFSTITYRSNPSSVGKIKEEFSTKFITSHRTHHHLPPLQIPSGFPAQVEKLVQRNSYVFRDISKYVKSETILYLS